MRRFLVCGLLLILLPLSTTALATGAIKEYKDQFNEVSYTGDDGSLHWPGPWIESESDGPDSGKVQVDQDDQCEDDTCLHMQIGLLGGPYAYRLADTSVFTEAELCFGLSAQGLGLLGRVYLDVTTNHGGSWTQGVRSWTASQLGSPIHPEIEIDDYLSEGFGVRFRVTGLLGGEAYVDNVEIMGLMVATTTTTTTSATTTSAQGPITTTSTSQPTTTTSQPKTTTSTSAPTTTSSTARTSSTTSTNDRPEATTTTTIAGTTTTTNGQFVLITPGGGPPEGSGIRVSKAGVQANFESGLHGGMDMMNAEVLGVELRPNFSMAVEVIEASWIWMIGLALIIATAIVTGLDRRRSVRGLQAT